MVHLTPGRLPASAAALRAEVRAFLAEAAYEPRCDAWLSGWDPQFSAALGARGWLGMTIPTEYGGQGRSPLERYVVTEELLAAGAPVAAHWVADRQTAPSLLRHGSAAQRRRFLPAISRGECFFAIGMSEPDTGSDLASVRTRAEPVEGGFRVTGTKVWTGGAAHAHAFFVLCRTAPREDTDRHAGLSQLIVDLAADGVTVRPIRTLSGEAHLNEVVLDGVYVAEDMVLGRVGDGWRQVTAELALERSGPERLLSTFPLLVALVGELAGSGRGEPEVGALVARLWALRQMSIAVAAQLADGGSPEVEAALVKDVGTRFEREVVEAARLLVGTEPDPDAAAGSYPRLLAEAVLATPGFTLRGGTSEVLRGMVARGLGVR